MGDCSCTQPCHPESLSQGCKCHLPPTVNWVQQQQVCHPWAARMGIAVPHHTHAFGILERGLMHGAGGFTHLYPCGPHSTARPVVPPKCLQHQEGAATIVQLQEDCRLALFP